MSLIMTILPYAAAYCVLSICVGLVVGRLLRNLAHIPAIGTPEILEARTWRRADYVPTRTDHAAELSAAVLT